MADDRARQAGWEFTDDRGSTATGPGTPPRVVAYVRAGAALWEYGIRPVAVYGSGHDSGARADPAKLGGLDPREAAYLGGGADITAEVLRELRPDVVVDVTYDGKSAYALAEDAAEQAGVPVVALGVGGGAPLRTILGRFAELAAAFGAPAPAADGELAAAEAELRELAAGAGTAGVVALSPGGPEQVHLARPETWPELRHLADLGVRTPDPGPGPGVNWRTTDWDQALEAVGGAGVLLADARANAVPLAELAGVPAWQQLARTAQVLPWNPELPPAPGAYAQFLRAVAAALRAPGPAAG
ncbi:ABC transporter substrate-binding protein [Actinacidiphila sp. bgisy144]|uniref:ABC transporter substrate-binding protein n=1 Tax=Actinacidiphila sp. bgisy144 TaxID=3413791 RepID=UPI003EBC0C1C